MGTLPVVPHPLLATRPGHRAVGSRRSRMGPRAATGCRVVGSRRSRMGPRSATGYRSVASRPSSMGPRTATGYQSLGSRRSRMGPRSATGYRSVASRPSSMGPRSATGHPSLGGRCACSVDASSAQIAWHRDGDHPSLLDDAGWPAHDGGRERSESVGPGLHSRGRRERPAIRGSGPSSDWQRSIHQRWRRR
jgi:hypothetical protein